MKSVFEMSDEEIASLYVEKGIEFLSNEEQSFIYKKVKKGVLALKNPALHLTSSGEMKHVTEMSKKEVLELYISNEKLDYSDEVYLVENFSKELYEISKIIDKEERTKYLNKL